MNKWLRRGLVGLAVPIVTGLALHVGVGLTTRVTPPDISAFAAPHLSDVITEADGTTRRLGGSYTRVRHGVREVHLEGTPEQLGSGHALLMRQEMIGIERDLYGDFGRYVPLAPARALLMDLGRVRYRDVDRGMPAPRLRELAAQAAAFQPDPFDDRLPTYHRFVFLHALYDIALGFEHSPLVGCSSFVLGPEATADGHTLLARAFDFEVGDEFDRDKAVYFVKEAGAIPFASVAWPGLIGVMSGMNAEGVAIVVHGGRAREPQSSGLPVVYSMRDVLARAHDVSEAVAVLRAQPVMVSHIVLVADAKGQSAIVERAPGVEAWVRPEPDPSRVPLTNHFEGPLAGDPKNVTVRARTTTVDRRARLDEMLATVGPHQADVPRAIAMLRDRTCANGVTCAVGDRRAIDAVIATHGIVADTTAHALYVTAGPHLSGEFVRYDLDVELGSGGSP